MTTRFLITGESGVGKSTLACSLYVRLRMEGVDTALYELDPWSDTHDCILGRKPWHERNKRSGQDVYDDYQRGVERFMNDDATVVIGDMEGSVEWRYNQLLQGSAHHGILLWRTAQGGKLHHELLDELNIPLLMELLSIPADSDLAFTGTYSVRGLNRYLAPLNRDVMGVVSHIRDTVQAEDQTS